MTNRTILAEAILAQTPWEDAIREPLAGDASTRRYERLTDRQSGRTAIFMDAPPENGENVRRFTEIALHLTQLGFSAPEIYAEDAEYGFLLLEDLGDSVFTNTITQEPGLERQLYEAATDLLIELRDKPVLSSLDSFGPTVMAQKTGIAFEHYVAGITGDPSSDLRSRFEIRFEDVLHRATQGAKVLIHRDYHADNLIWLPERSGIQRVGLLDFQDAVQGHPAYDLVSLLQDVRREVPAGIGMQMIQRYIASTGDDDHSFRTAYAVLGVQRNLRILGVFARLAKQFGKPHYVDLIPSVWTHLMRNLEHPALVPVADTLRGVLPLPSTENLELLKSR